MGMDEAHTLVRALCSYSVAPVPWPLLHAAMLKNDLFLISLHLLCVDMDEARAWICALCSCTLSPVLPPLLHA